jgi:hypothetical protein
VKNRKNHHYGSSKSKSRSESEHSACDTEIESTRRVRGGVSHRGWSARARHGIRARLRVWTRALRTLSPRPKSVGEPDPVSGTTTSTTSTRGAHGTEGAAIIETLVAFPFFYLFFTTIVQLTFLESAALVTQHAAVVAARAAIVVGPDDPQYYGGSAVDTLSGRRKDEIVEAVKLLTSTATDKPEVEVELTGGLHEGGTVHAKVTLVYPCRIPFGGRFACGLRNTRRITRHAEMPYQGAAYDYP